MEATPNKRTLWEPDHKNFLGPAHRTMFGLDKDAVVFDIGANMGGMTTYFFVLNPTCFQHVFEPVPGLLQRCQEALTPAQRDQCSFHCLGISDQPGWKLGCHLYNCWTILKPEESKLEMSPGMGEYGAAEAFDVEFTTIDHYVKTNGLTKVNFMKIDTDGYDAKVLIGAAETLKTLRPYMLIELSYLVQDIGNSIKDFCHLLFAHDYMLVAVDGSVVDDPTTLLAYFPYNTSCDVFLIPKEKASLFDLHYGLY